VIFSLLLLLNSSAISFTASASTACTDADCAEHVHAEATALAEGSFDLASAFVGDLDGNDAFTVSDMVLLAKQIVTTAKGSTDEVKATDINGDYKTSITDLVRFKKHLSADGAVDFTYEIVDGEAVVTGCVSAPEGCVTLPFELDGCPVTKIAASAFENYDEITGILIPSSVTDIEDNAFSNCSSLKNMAIPDSVYNLGKNAFLKCSSISSIRLSDNIKIICEGTFSNCTLLSKLVLPDIVEEIGQSAFYLCSSLVELNIPKKVTVLNDDTFFGCSSLVFIGLPENLKEIKCYTFYGCEKLQSISIPITVINVGDNAFDSCISLLSVVVPYETAFGSNVFTNCPVLVVEGLAGAGGIDAAINSGANYELMDCGHAEFILLNAKNPTCTQVGFSGDQYCIKCGKIEQPGFEVAKTGHITELKNVKAVTCTEDGYTGDTVCTVCSHTLDYGWPIYCEGHFAQNMPGYVAPTCTQEGVYGIFTCEKCGEDINNEAIPAIGHDKYYANRVDAVCQKDGYSGDYMCFVCKEVFKKGSVIPRGEHNYQRNNYKYATCTQEGYTGDYICTGCGDVYSRGEVVQKRAHDLYTTNYKA
ncbi:MAG: leucine-rich repeat protein, partial [Clostridia bacterium]|nr:leucine-rich repeat protein [Clostridia bacterium]